MRARLPLAVLLFCAPAWIAASARAQAVPPDLSPPPSLSPHAAAEAARALVASMRQALGSDGIPAPAAVPSPASARAAIMARAMLDAAGVPVERPQLVLVVDRAPAVQRLWVMLATPDAAEPWKMLGVVHVSTGRPGKKEHFKTPVGVFTNTPAILGYRAQGTLNEHGIRGNGVKGMRVWDFGWQTTEDWRKDGALTAVRLEMHATDPTFLAGRLGRPDSEACIRIPEKFNTFLDQAGLIDAQLLAVAPQDRAVRALLPKDAAPTPLAGDKVVVVDSSEPRAARSDPVLAGEINQRFADFLAEKAAEAAGGAAGVLPAAATVTRPEGPATPAAAGTEPTPVDPVPPLPDPSPGPALPAAHAAASPRT